MLAPLLAALVDLTDWRLARILLGSVLLAGAAFAGIAFGTGEWAAHLAAGHGWLTTLAAALGGALALLAALWLFLPVAVLIASLFQNEVCRVVERRAYPALPPPVGAGVVAQLAEGLAAGLLVAGAEVAALCLALLPGIGLVLAFAVTAWGLGRAFFVPVAMRRMTRAEARTLYRAHRGEVLVQGAFLAALGHVPLANLLLPVLAPALMVHLLMRRARPGAG